MQFAYQERSNNQALLKKRAEYIFDTPGSVYLGSLDELPGNTNLGSVDLLGGRGKIYRLGFQRCIGLDIFVCSEHLL
jgi:hypothetical protein